MKYTSVIFDWDGTLGMTLHLWLAAYRNTLQNLGFNYSDEVIVEDFFYEHNKTILKYPEIDWPVFLKQVVDYMASHASTLPMYEGVHDTLEKLQKNNITLTLVSSSPRKLLKEELKQHNLDNFFRAIVAGDDIMRHKPNPEAFLNIIEIAKLNPKTALVLGDSHTDIVAAKAAGLDSCLFLPIENKIFYDFDKLKESNPTYCVETLKDFTNLVIYGLSLQTLCWSCAHRFFII